MYFVPGLSWLLQRVAINLQKTDHCYKIHMEMAIFVVNSIIVRFIKKGIGIVFIAYFVSNVFGTGFALITSTVYE